jgi:hypothetical protein
MQTTAPIIYAEELSRLFEKVKLGGDEEEACDALDLVTAALLEGLYDDDECEKIRLCLCENRDWLNRN